MQRCMAVSVFAAALFAICRDRAGIPRYHHGSCYRRAIGIRSQCQMSSHLVNTGGRSQTTTGTDGLFTVPFLAPGIYRLEADAPGFKHYIRDNVEVNAGDRVGIDIQLRSANMNETVTVTAEAPMLDTTSATAGQVINSSQVENLPMNGRTPLVLAQLAYGRGAQQRPEIQPPVR